MSGAEVLRADDMPEDMARSIDDLQRVAQDLTQAAGRHLGGPVSIAATVTVLAHLAGRYAATAEAVGYSRAKVQRLIDENVELGRASGVRAAGGGA